MTKARVYKDTTGSFEFPWIAVWNFGGSVWHWSYPTWEIAYERATAIATVEREAERWRRQRT